MEGEVTGYSGATLTINVTTVGGSGTKTDWVINLAGGVSGSGDVLGGSALSTQDAIPYVTATAATLGQSTSSAWHFNQAAMVRWKAIIGLSGTAPAAATGRPVYCALGDSWTGTTPSIIAGKLWRQWGNGGSGYIDASSNGIVPLPAGLNSKTPAGTWTYTEGGVFAGPAAAHSKTTDLATPGKMTFTGVGQNIVIYWRQLSNGQDFEWQVDSGGYTTVATHGADALGVTTILSGGSLALHTVEVRVRAEVGAGDGTAGFLLYGANFTRTGNGAVVHNLGRNGIQLSALTSATAAVQASLFQNLGCDIVAFTFGVNEWVANTTPATLTSGITTVAANIATAATALGRSIDVLLVPSGPWSDGGQTYVASDYAKAQSTLARTAGYGFIDVAKEIGTYTVGNANGMFLNTTHLSSAGWQRTAQMISAFLDEGLSHQYVSPFGFLPQFSNYSGAAAGGGLTSYGPSAYGLRNYVSGYAAGQSMTSASDDTLIGASAGALTTTGYSLTCVGAGSCYTNVSGVNNTGVGYYALRLATSSSNAGFGFQAGNGISSGAQHTIIGSNSGSSVTTGAGNTLLGYSSNLPSATQRNYAGCVGWSCKTLDLASSFAIGRYETSGTTDTVQLGGYLRVGSNSGDGHFLSIGTLPTIGACGTSPSISSTSTDQAGIITIGTGGSATSCVITFAKTWVNEPSCTASHEGAILLVRETTTTTTLTIDASSPLTASGKIKYSCNGSTT